MRIFYTHLFPKMRLAGILLGTPQLLHPARLVADSTSSLDVHLCQPPLSDYQVHYCFATLSTDPLQLAGTS